MAQYVFNEQVKKHFGYLMDDYGFSVAEERYDAEIFGNSLVRFRLGPTQVRVVLDKGQVRAEMAPYPEIRGRWFILSEVIGFLAPEADERGEIVVPDGRDYDRKVDWQLARMARILRQYCKPVLRAEFSQWDEMDEAARRESMEIYRALTGKEPMVIDSKEAREKLWIEEGRRRYEARTGKRLPRQGECAEDGEQRGQQDDS